MKTNQAEIDILSVVIKNIKSRIYIQKNDYSKEGIAWTKHTL